MTNVEPGQVWEAYSTDENRWSRVIVTKVEDGRATLRYKGVLEFLTVDVGDMLTCRSSRSSFVRRLRGHEVDDQQDFCGLGRRVKMRSGHRLCVPCAFSGQPPPRRSLGCGPLERLQNSAKSAAGRGKGCPTETRAYRGNHPGMAGEMIRAGEIIAELRATPTEPAGEHSTRRLAPP